MRFSEILRTVADTIDRSALAQSVPQQRDDLRNFSEPEEIEVTNNVEDPEDLFLPPLQMKQELLKKAVGVENVYDDGGPAEQDQAEQDDESEEGGDIVDRIKQLSGIPLAAIQELSNDEVFDD